MQDCSMQWVAYINQCILGANSLSDYFIPRTILLTLSLKSDTIHRLPSATGVSERRTNELSPAGAVSLWTGKQEAEPEPIF